VRVVSMEQKECRRCKLKGWAGDDIYRDGVFNFNGTFVVELRVLYRLRQAVCAGTPVSTWVKTFLRPLLEDMEWTDASDENRSLAKR